MKIISKTGEGKKGIFDWLSMILLAVAVIFTSYVMIMNVRGKPVSVFGYSILKVMTGSMEPTLGTGEYIIVKKTPVSDLAVGDIITFYTEDPEIRGLLVTHRILAINPDGTMVSKGDANPVEDYVAVAPDKILGRFACKARFFGMIGAFADKRKLIMVLVIIPITAMALYEMRTLAKLWKKLEDENKEQDEASKTSELDRQAEIERIKAEAIAEFIKNREGKENGEGEEGQEEQGSTEG